MTPGGQESRFVLEAKVGVNQWVAVERIYDQIISSYTHRPAAHLAKAALKEALLGKWKHRFKKYPIRIREIPHPMDRDDILGGLARGMARLDSSLCETFAHRALGAGILPRDGMVNGLCRGLFPMEENNGAYFLPQLGISTRILKRVLGIFYSEKKPPWAETPVIIGVIKGDVHDVGKTLLIKLLRAGGFFVVDMGVDVAPEDFVQVARKTGAGLICLSTHLTTALGEMEGAVAALQSLEKGPRILVGGGVVTRDFAQGIGAHGYAATAPGGLCLAMEWMVGNAGLPQSPLPRGPYVDSQDEIGHPMGHNAG